MLSGIDDNNFAFYDLHMRTVKNYEWTFFTNHSHVLICLAQNPETPLRVVAEIIGITERAVQRLVLDLENAGVLKRTRVGRSNRYQLDLSVSLRHPLEQHRTIGEVLSPLLEPEGSLPTDEKTPSV